jgi:hypothetical protein
MAKKIANAYFGMTHLDNMDRLTDLLTMAEMKAIVRLARRAAGMPYHLVGCNADDMSEACGTKDKPMSPKTMSNMITKFKKLNILHKDMGSFYLNPTLFYSGNTWEACKGWWIKLFGTLVIIGEKGDNIEKK